MRIVEIYTATNQTIAWEEGKTLCFDDTFRHEAWNSSTTQRRVVLMVDFYYEGKTSERNPDFVKYAWLSFF